MHRRAFLLLFLAPLLAPVAAAAQMSPPGASGPISNPAPVTQKQEPVSNEVSAAEAAIASTDWKTAEATLDSWLAAHPKDARALFDAGYVADVQNRSADAASLYSRAIQADPDNFDAHLLLGILLAREGKLTDARTQLASATQLDPGEGGPELKARAWRALARIDSNTDPTTASNDLLQALKTVTGNPRRHAPCCRPGRQDRRPDRCRSRIPSRARQKSQLRTRQCRLSPPAHQAKAIS